MNEIRIGVIGKKVDGWQLILEQEGVSFTLNPSTIHPDKCSMLIVGDGLNQNELQSVHKYLFSGGAILCSSKIFSGISGNKCTDTFIRYLHPEPSSLFSAVGLIDVNSKAALPHNANEMLKQNGHSSIYIGDYNGGKIIVLPFDAGEIVLDKRTTEKTFYAKHNRLPYERVSLISKGKISRLISRAIEILHHQRGLPYIHKWYFPRDLQTIFAWRIDTDYATQEEIKKLYKLLNKNAIPASWFVHVESQQSFLSIYKEMVDQEIGIHCYEHKTYKDYERNFKNINAAVEMLKKNGINANGFVAPYGRWNDPLAKAIDEINVVYSSEFSYDYDNLPSFPFTTYGFAKTLQLPIHPLSIGSLIRQGFSVDKMKEYFQSIIDQKILNREPLLLYHHPKNNHEEVLQCIFNFISQRNIKKVRMIEFAEWWKRRHLIKFAGKLEGDILNLDESEIRDDVWVHITKANGKEAFTSIRSKINLSELNWKKRPDPYHLPEDFRRIYKFNPWIMFQKFEDKTIGKFKRK